MSFIGKEMEDMLIQKAYEKLRKRGYSQPISKCYWSLLGILQREGEAALDRYVASVKI